MDYINILIVICAFLAIILFTVAVVGVIRLPDFYSRVHSASIGDTLSTMFLLLSAILYFFFTHDAPSSYLTSAKLFFILIFMCLTGPTGVHTLINAGYELGIKPYLKKKENEELKEDEKTNQE